MTPTIFNVDMDQAGSRKLGALSLMLGEGSLSLYSRQVAVY